MMFKGVLRRIWKTLVYMFALAGLIFQISKVSDEYFTYPTTTFITVQDFSNQTVPPLAGVCISFDGINSMYFNPFYQLFSNYSHPSYVEDSQIVSFTQKVLMHDESDPSLVKLVRFLKDSQYCLTVFPKKEIVHSRKNLLLSPDSSFYTATIKTDFFRRLVKRPKWKRDWSVTYLAMSSRKTGFEVPLRSLPSKNIRDTGMFDTLFWSTSYSLMIIRQQPPPFDTQCLNYRISKFEVATKFECYNECVRTKAAFFLNKIPKHVLIDRERFKDDKKLKMEGVQHFSFEQQDVNLKKYRKRANEKLKKYIEGQRKKNQTIDLKKVKKLEDDYPRRVRHYTQIKRVQIDCYDLCRRSDCDLELVVPIPIEKTQFNSIEDKNSSSNHSRRLELLTIVVKPSAKPLMIVTSRPKIEVLDFIVFILSVVSFWTGFDPLILAESSKMVKIRKKFRIRSRKKRQSEKRLFIKRNQKNLR